MFEIINQEHTPKVPVIKNINKWIEENNDLLKEYLIFTSSQTTAVGLASNQVSFEGKRITDRFLAIKRNDKWLIAINPRIRKRLGDPHQKIEGCLTWGHSKIIVADRHETVDIDYYTVDGEYQKERVSGFDAQVWQHEINHLDGVEEVVLDKAPVQYRRANKIGRNDPCPCGSGKKYKKCHLGLDINEFLV